MTRRAEMMKLLDPRVVSELARGVPGFDRAGLLSALVEAWGGQDEVAKSIHQEFLVAGRGSMVRQRILDLFCRMLSQHSNDEHVRPVEDMNEEELRRAIASTLPDIAARIGVPKEKG